MFKEISCSEFFFFRFLNDTDIAKAQRDFELKKAAYDVEVQTKVTALSFIPVLSELMPFL